jgi:hypothetical protein
VIPLSVKILLSELSVEVVVDPSGELHLIDKVKQHFRADVFYLGKCDILVLRHILDLRVSYLAKHIV